MMPFIRVTDLVKAYPESVIENEATIRTFLVENEKRLAAGVSFALREVSFEVHDGERVGLIGSNGAGKTTLMRVLAGLTQPSAGTVDVSGNLGAILTIGSSLREDMTGRENLQLAARLAGHAEEKLQAVTEEMIAFAELEHFIDWPVRTYSSGMKARLNFAGTIFIDPEILLIDEALSVGDRSFAGKATAAVRKLCDGGRIVMIVSHSTETIAAMCDRCIWLENGQIVMDGPAKEVADAYEEATRLKFERAMMDATQNRDAILDPRVTAAGDLSIGLRNAPPSNLMPVPSPVLALSYDLTLGEAMDELDITIVIERLDGLMVTQSRISVDGPHSSGELTLDIEVPNFFLSSGFYLIEIDVSSGGTLLVQIGGHIQIKSDITYQHGTPTLSWPILLSIAGQ